MTVYPLNYNHHPNDDALLPLNLSIHSLSNGFVAHRHDYLELSLVLEGTGWESINGIRYRKVPGTFTFVLPYQVHEIYTDPGSCITLYNAEFSTNLLFGSDRDIGMKDLLLGEDPPRPSHIQLHGGTFTHIKELLDELYREFLGDSLWRIPLVKAKLTEVLVHFDRLRSNTCSPSIPAQHLIEHTKKSRHSEKAFWEIIQYIHLHNQDEITLQHLSTHFHISVSHLCELLKRYSGKTFLELLNEVRIRHACGLLASTEMSMEHIALEVGYGSYKTFSRIFKHHRNMTASDYRRLTK